MTGDPMGMARRQARPWLRGVAGIVDIVLHVVAFLIVLAEVSEALGSDTAIAVGLLFPVTYLVGPLALGIAGAEWLAFVIQLGATLGAVGLVGVPVLDREQPDTRLGCLQVVATTLLVIVVDLTLHVAALALVIGHVNRELDTGAAIAATLLFPLTYLVGPIALAFLGVDWLPLVLQVAAFGLIGLLVLLSDA